VLDNLDIHRSASLVRYVADRDGLAPDLGIKYVRGVLRSRASRAAFLADPTHSIVFHYTPKHASWLNQVEIWLSILVRKLLRRGNFRSVEDLRDQVLAFIAYFNRTTGKCAVAYTPGVSDAGTSVTIVGSYAGDANYASTAAKAIVSVTK
jgi:transposase